MNKSNGPLMFTICYTTRHLFLWVYCSIVSAPIGHSLVSAVCSLPLQQSTDTSISRRCTREHYTGTYFYLVPGVALDRYLTYYRKHLTNKIKTGATLSKNFMLGFQPPFENRNMRPWCFSIFIQSDFFLRLEVVFIYVQSLNVIQYPQPPP